MAYRALNTLLLGRRPPVEAGEIIPDTYLDMHGGEQPVDFDQLAADGLAEEVRSHHKDETTKRARRDA